MALTSWVEAFDLAQWPRIVHDVLRPADSYARSRFIEMIESRGTIRLANLNTRYWAASHRDCQRPLIVPNKLP